MNKVITCVFGCFLLLDPSPGFAADEQPFPVGQMVRQEQVLLPRDHRGEQPSNQGQDCRPGIGPGYGRPCVRDHRTDPDPPGQGGQTGQAATELSIRECVKMGGSVEYADAARCTRGYVCVTYNYNTEKFLTNCITEASADGLD